MNALRDVTVLETCFDGALSLELEMDSAVDEPLMRTLAVDAKLDYYPSFPKPYFRICVENKHIIQGVLGNNTVRVTCKEQEREQIIDALRRRIEEVTPHGRETQTVLRACNGQSGHQGKDAHGHENRDL